MGISTHQCTSLCSKRSYIQKEIKYPHPPQTILCNIDELKTYTTPTNPYRQYANYDFSHPSSLFIFQLKTEGDYTTAPGPGGVKSSRLAGQAPRLAGSPPIRTNTDFDGTPLSNKNSWNQPGGQTLPLGGAVIVQVLPAQVKAGKIVR